MLAKKKTKPIKKKSVKSNIEDTKKKKTVSSVKSSVKNKNKYFATGRRKTSVARVILVNGKGNFIINKKKAEDYLLNKYLLSEVLKPLKLTNKINKFDVMVNVYGGGFNSQVGAIRLGISRALLNTGIDHKILKGFGLLSRDSRTKERKKYGLKAARKAPQFSKR